MAKILCWNIVSLRALLKKNNIINNKESVKNNFENFIKKYKFDIICLQEIKLCKNTISLLLDIFPDYKYKYYNIPHTKKAYSGVCILSKKEPISHSDKFNEVDGRYIEVEFDKFYLINIYATNAGPNLERLDIKDEFNKKLNNKINRLRKKKEVIVLGDFNAIQLKIDTYDYDKHINKLAGVTDLEIKNLNKLIDSGLLNVYRELHGNKEQYSYFTYRWPSRSKNKGLLIDFVLATKKIFKDIKKIEYLDNIYGSDHIPLYIEINTKL